MAKPREEDFADPADSIHASFCPDIAAAIDTPADELAEALGSRNRERLTKLIAEQVRAQVEDKIAATILMVLGILDLDDKPALGIQCCLFAINRNPLSGTQIAKRFGVTKAAVSKRIIRYCELLQLSTARGMKRSSVRATYRNRQIAVAKTFQKTNPTWQTALLGNIRGIANDN